jgi:hypothetical protein
MTFQIKLFVEYLLSLTIKKICLLIMWPVLCQVKDEERGIRTLQGTFRDKYRIMVE